MSGYLVLKRAGFFEMLLRSLPSIALRIPTAHPLNFTRD